MFGELSAKRIAKRTRYDIGKQTKMDNFTFLNKNFCREGQTVLLGDSITKMCDVTDFYADYTAKTGLAVYNRGISGDTSDRLLERLQDNVISIKPKNIVLLIGTNDLGVKSGLDFTANNVRQIVRKIKSDCPNTKLILQAIYPVNKTVNPVGARKNSDIAVVNAKLKAIAEQEQIIFADFTSILSDENGRLNKAYTYDGLHPNAVGFSVTVKEILKLL